VKFVFLLELRPNDYDVDGFLLDQTLLLPTAKETWEGVRVVARQVCDTEGNYLMQKLWVGGLFLGAKTFQGNGDYFIYCLKRDLNKMSAIFIKILFLLVLTLHQNLNFSTMERNQNCRGNEPNLFDRCVNKNPSCGTWVRGNPIIVQPFENICKQLPSYLQSLSEHSLEFTL